DDDRLGLVLIAIIGLQIERATRTAEVCLGYRAEQVDARAETLRLRLHALDQFLPGHWLGEARIILDLVGQRHLTAQLMPGDDQWMQLGARRIQRRRQPSGAGPDNDPLFLLRPAARR